MNISTVAASAGTAPSAGNGTKAVGGSGFAGALVQAIGGSGNADGSTSEMNPSLGLLGLIGVVNPQDQGAGDEQTSTVDSLSAMLANLTDKLQQAKDSQEVADDIQNQLAGLLAGLQQLLAQLDQTNQLPGNGNAESEQSLTQLSVLIQNADLPPEQLANIAQQLKQVLVPLATKEASQDAKSTENSTVHMARMNETAGQQSDATTAVQGEVKRTITAFREPVLLWHLTQGAATSDADGENELPTGESPVEADTSTSLAWTLQHAGSTGKTDASAAKAALPEQVPVTQFADQMQKFLVKQFTLSGGNGISEAKLNLNPEHLGQVQIHIVMQNGQLSAQFIAHNEAARSMLESQMSQLRNSLQEQGIQVDRVEVVQQQTLADSPSFLSQQQRQSQSGQGGEESQGNGSASDEAIDFEAEMERTSSLRDAGYGNSLNVTA